MNNARNRVVITGMGLRTPLGSNVNETWTNLIAGESGISTISLFDTTGYSCKIAAQYKGDYDPEKYGFQMNRGSFLGLEAVGEALTCAGLFDVQPPNNRCGLLFGNSGYRASLEDFNQAIVKNKAKEVLTINDISLPTTYYQNRYASAAEAINQYYGLQGCSNSLTTACTSGTQAIGIGYRRIQAGKEKILVAGGSDSMITQLDIIGFCMLGAVTSKYNDNPQMGSRPFNRDRSGFVLGEGGAALVLEEYQHACERGAKIIAELVGFGNTISAYSILDTQPDGNGLARAMIAAINEAGIEHNEIGYINAHGTSTSDNDASEASSIKKVFGEKAAPYVSSTKASTGHMISAAGTAELIFTIKSLYEQILPPTRNLADIDGKCELKHVYEAMPYHSSYAMSNSLGFGGSNSSIIVKRWDLNAENG